MMVLGDLVKLRAMEPSDAESLWRWNHDPDVMRWMDDGYAQPLARVEKWLAERPRNDYADVLFGIEVLSDATLIGLVRLHDAEPETGCAELDIYLGEKEHWGQGYATDAVRTVCRYGFDKMRLHKITLTVVTENHAARHVYAKVGFVEEGRLRQVFRRDGQWYDKFTMGLLEGELRPERGASMSWNQIAGPCPSGSTSGSSAPAAPGLVVVAQHRLPERTDRGDVERVDRYLQDLDRPGGRAPTFPGHRCRQWSRRVSGVDAGQGCGWVRRCG